MYVIPFKQPDFHIFAPVCSDKRFEFPFFLMHSLEPNQYCLKDTLLLCHPLGILSEDRNIFSFKLSVRKLEIPEITFKLNGLPKKGRGTQ